MAVANVVVAEAEVLDEVVTGEEAVRIAAAMAVDAVETVETEEVLDVIKSSKPDFGGQENVEPALWISA